MASIMLVCSDLLNRVQLESSWKAAGLAMVNASQGESPHIIVLDLSPEQALHQIAPLKASHPDAQLVAFGPHLQGERLLAAKQQGADLVVARSSVVERVIKLAQAHAQA
ncbi:hypothetical protein Mmc1_0294 [Magnetococcus marinus MC-1]|uniref:Response regulator receiver protein n=1 Tax=Magnetococcus marinus (strain ATCC BAA-1437 / JCM 17883 / MC-1) TaxID=156889 RepID=A0L4C8_MAGMM|nr:hypothetical protein [Magnetococcus marinus]ABK42821.1 hypothetical protein Mmc1_0294 [Magnetococcus marinus MC-1]